MTIVSTQHIAVVRSWQQCLALGGWAMKRTTLFSVGTAVLKLFPASIEWWAMRSVTLFRVGTWNLAAYFACT